MFDRLRVDFSAYMQLREEGRCDEDDLKDRIDPHECAELVIDETEVVEAKHDGDERVEDHECRRVEHDTHGELLAKVH